MRPTALDDMTTPTSKDIRPAFPQPTTGDRVRPKLIELLGLDQLPGEPDFISSEAKEEDGVRVTRFTFVNSLAETVPGVLMMPMDASGQALAGVVCLPETGDDVEGVANRRFYQGKPPTTSLVGWGRELARRGFATLSISLKGCVNRRVTIERWEQEAKLLAPYGRPQMGVLVEEALTAARILASTEGVDPGRIGLTGFSLGGIATTYAMACADWIRAGVVECGGLGSIMHQGNVQFHSSYYFIPHMLRYFDQPEIVASCIAPRPLMIVAPTSDSMPPSAVDDLARVVAPTYESLERPEQFKVYRPPGEHLFLPQHFEWMVDWFKRFLAAPSQEK